MLQTDVVIVGFGPTAQVAANWLGALGWRVAVVERSTSIYPLPRAVHFDDEVMRVFQQLDLADRIEAITQPVRGMDLVNQAGHLLARYTAPQGVGPLGWQQGFMFQQPELERLLREGVARYPNVQVLTGHEVENLEILPDGALVMARDLGGGEPVRIQSRFVLGCCGARSITRSVIGGQPFDFEARKTWILVDLVLRNDAGLPDATIQYCDPSRPSTSIPTPGATRRFELMLMPGEDGEEMVQPERIAALLAPWLQPTDYDIVRAATYTFHAMVAQRWRQGPLLIAGDAAHLMPPFLGQGLCSGVRDVANLCWKLDLVLRGVAAPSLLDTYQAEREPHVRAMIESDLWLANVIQTTDPEVARQRDQQMLADPAGSAMVPPTPALGGDLCADGPMDRRPFPQPVESGQRQDARLGAGFALVGQVALSEKARTCLQRLGARVEHEAGPTIAQWLRDRGAQAVLVRPDRYVMALITTPESLDAALEPLARHFA